MFKGGSITMDKQGNNNPQDNVPVKSVETPKRKELSEIMMPYIGQAPKQFGGELQERCYPVTAVIDIVHEYASPLKNRISELEALNKEYREALERVSLVHKNRKTTDNFYLMCKAIEIAQQALNPKPLTDG